LGDRQLRQSIEQQFRDRGVTVLPEEASAAGAASGLSLVVVATSQSEEPLVLERLPSLLCLNAPIIVASSEPSDAFGYRAHRVGADHIVRLPEELADIVTFLAAEKGQLSLPAVPGTARPKPFAAATDKILIIDDTETNRVLATRQLQQLGLASDTAADGQEGLEKAAARSYSAILIDDSMPVMDGAEFMRRWREFEAERGRPRTPLIAMTARAQVGEAERYLSLGADDYLPKPVTLSKLDATLKKWLDPASGERQGEAPAAIERNARTRNGSQAVDLDALAETIGDADPATLREMMEVFLADFPELMARVLRSVGSGGGAELARAAHAAKSAAGSACAKPLSALLGAIEDRAARPLDGELKALLAEAESEFARVQSELGARFGRAQHRRPPLPSSVPLQREPIVADSPDAA
jgi:CheY-like chemotaxis protein